MKLDIPNAEVIYEPALLKAFVADALLYSLIKNVKWQQDSYNFGGQKVLAPRLTAWYGDVPYSYSGLTQQPQQWLPELGHLRELLIESGFGVFNSALLNYYRDGNDSVSWHSDDESELGINPVIASISLGATRQFELKNKFGKSKPFKLNLEHGSLLVMSGETQHNYRHRIPKEKNIIDPRINLTFRYMHPK